MAGMIGMSSQCIGKQTWMTLWQTEPSAARHQWLNGCATAAARTVQQRHILQQRVQDVLLLNHLHTSQTWRCMSGDACLPMHNPSDGRASCKGTTCAQVRQQVVCWHACAVLWDGIGAAATAVVQPWQATAACAQGSAHTAAHTQQRTSPGMASTKVRPRWPSM